MTTVATPVPAADWATELQEIAARADALSGSSSSGPSRPRFRSDRGLRGSPEPVGMTL